jgi:hypothetical protein
VVLSLLSSHMASSLKVFSIPELLDLILHECSPVDLVAFATTCRAASVSALDKLWACLPSLMPLIDTIPYNGLYKARVIDGIELVENFQSACQHKVDEPCRTTTHVPDLLRHKL